MATFKFSAAGVSGGFLHWHSDTVDELRDNITQGLLDAGYAVVRCDLSWSDLDVLGKLFHGTFPYSVTLEVRNNFVTNAATAREDVRRVLKEASGGNEPTGVSNLDAGEPAQDDPAIDVAGIAQAATLPLALIAVIAVAVIVLIAKVE